MLEQLVYKNHLGEVFEFGKNGIFVNCNELHDFEWDITAKNNRIAYIGHTKIKQRKIPIRIICDNVADGIAAKNRLYEVMEKDTLAMKYGQIVLGGYYFRCFATRSQKKNYLLNKGMLEVTLTVSTDKPVWVKETTHTFLPPSAASSDTQGLGYPYGYPYDYVADINAQSCSNPSFSASNFKLVFFGACRDPAVTIGGHTYSVECDIGHGEYLTIDSTAKTIYLTQNDGTKVNYFRFRNKEQYVFEKIPSGTNSVAWDGTFGFDLILLEERSEPKWT